MGVCEGAFMGKLTLKLEVFFLLHNDQKDAPERHDSATVAVFPSKCKADLNQGKLAKENAFFPSITIM